jgi:hypothetical protein
MAGAELRHLADVEEITIGFRLPDGSAGSRPIWVVQAGDEVFVRSIRGRRGGWYRRLRADPDGEVRDGGHTHPVRAEPVSDPATIAQVTQAYVDKYGGSPYVRPLLEEPGIGATLRLVPR